MRIASFNIRTGWAFDGIHSWPFRRWATAGAIRDLDADVVALQEVHGFQLRWLMRQLRGYGADGEGRDGGSRGERCPLLVRNRDVRALDVRTRWFGDEPERSGTRLPGASAARIATVGDLELTATSRRFRLVNTHLDARIPANRVRSAEQLAQWVDPTIPTVVLGDFNAPLGDAVIGVLEDVGLRSALPPGSGSTAHGFTGRRDGPGIDHILVSDHWAVHSAGVVRCEGASRRSLPSDHWPVVADLHLR
jgi:endonuclease/exonuclease/phosphatase family metal-dependent hydrolase